ncbi:MAG: hypothetical protein ACWGNV_08510 [Bacteroidales bacterium]
MVFLKYSIFPILVILLFLSSCSRNRNLPEEMTAHHIKYQIEYLEERAGDIPTRILPEQMDAYYTEHFVLSRITGFLEQFTLTQIADLRHERVTTLLRFFDSRVYYEGENGELPVAIIEPKVMKWKMTGETAVIGGLHSERVEVDTGEEQYSIYMTRDFDVRHPNITTPYRSIDYPLSEFRVQLSLLKMHLSCTDFDTETIESEVFEVPPGYSPVSKKDMERIINSLFTKE